MKKITEADVATDEGMDDIGRLIRLAGARDEVSAERLQRSRERVHAHWQQVLEQQRIPRRIQGLRAFATAAALATVVGLALMLANRSPSGPVSPVASVERVVGQLRVDGQAIGDGMIAPGATVVTGALDRVALRLSGGQALWIDVGSTVTVHAPNRLSLEAGALYVDTGRAGTEQAVLVQTPRGTARDIGTQFQVRLSAAAMIVGVLDGQVEVGPLGQPPQAVDAGYQVAFAGDGRQAQTTLDTDDPGWRWIDTVAPGFDIDGASLADYLAWFAQQDGLELVWADAASEQRARNTRLTGSLDGVGSRQGLDRVRQVAPFEYRLSEDQLWISVE